jgi:hypothetical protein
VRRAGHPVLEESKDRVDTHVMEMVNFIQTHGRVMDGVLEELKLQRKS